MFVTEEVKLTKDDATNDGEERQHSLPIPFLQTTISKTTGSPTTSTPLCGTFSMVPSTCVRSFVPRNSRPMCVPNTWCLVAATRCTHSGQKMRGYHLGTY